MAENRNYENGESHADEANFTSVDEIERLTGLDFLSDLDDEVEAALDVRKTTTIWFFDSDPVRSGSTSNHRRLADRFLGGALAVGYSARLPW